MKVFTIATIDASSSWPTYSHVYVTARKVKQLTPTSVSIDDAIMEFDFEIDSIVEGE